MLNAEVDKPNNVLRVRYSGPVTAEETQRGLDTLPQVLAELQPGFRLLADLSRLQRMDLACLPHLKRMMDACNEKGVELIVRVIPDPYKDIGLNIMSLFHYCRSVRIVTCKTVAEAEEALRA